uniref:Homeodomain mating-type protein HD1-2 n=1 Tax=Auricularia heimuer TaxID=1579977 RepID=A0A7D3V9Q6_9AGAM|nr:homeodomain mating-type protein HD1-2 [Auricularia heimuer]
MESSACDADIFSRLQRCPADFMCAYGSGDTSNFHNTWAAVCADIEDAQARGAVTLPTLRLAHTVSATIRSLASRFDSIEARTRHLGDDFQEKAQLVLNQQIPAPAVNIPTTPPTALPFPWVQPLLQFVLDNIHSPYPSSDEKQALLEQCAAAGWASVSQRKLEDWMNVTRNKMGYTRILKSDAVRENRTTMANYVRRVLSGRPADRKGIPTGAVRGVEKMQQWLHDQYETRAARDQTSSWARDVVHLVQNLRASSKIGSAAVGENDCLGDYDDDDVSDDDESLYSDNDSECSDSDTLYSETDVEDNFDVLFCSVIGAKRKFSGLGLGQPPARMVSRSSSSSSFVSHVTLFDESTNESSDSVFLTTYCDDERACDRPTKRSRSFLTADCDDERACDQPNKRRRSSLDDSSEERTSPTPTVAADSPPAKPKLFDHSYRSQKRKRSLTEDDATASPAKRVKHIVAPPAAKSPRRISTLSIPSVNLTGSHQVDFDEWYSSLLSAPLVA